MTLPIEELRKRREVLCERFGFVKDTLSFFRVPNQYKDDLIQEIFIAAYRNIDQVHDMEKLNSWLYKLSFRKMLTFMQKQRALDEREVLYSPEEWDREEFIECEAFHVWDIMNGSFGDGEIFDLVARLKYPAPQIIRLRFVDGYKLKEIAGILNLKYNTVKTIEHRAFRQLKQMIEKERREKDEDREA